MLGTNSGRAELREGLETMPLTRFHRKTAAVISVVLAFLLSLVVASPAAHAQPDADKTITIDGVGAAELGLTPAQLAAGRGGEIRRRHARELRRVR